MAEPQFGRLITAMITPFDENRDIDLKRTDEFVNRLINGGTDSIIVCGTTGESPTVFYPQKIEVNGMLRQSYETLPKIAIREGVLNSVIHRKYDHYHTPRKRAFTSISRLSQSRPNSLSSCTTFQADAS